MSIRLLSYPLHEFSFARPPLFSFSLIHFSYPSHSYVFPFLSSSFIINIHLAFTFFTYSFRLFSCTSFIVHIHLSFPFSPYHSRLISCTLLSLLVSSLTHIDFSFPFFPYSSPSYFHALFFSFSFHLLSTFICHSLSFHIPPPPILIHFFPFSFHLSCHFFMLIHRGLASLGHSAFMCVDLVAWPSQWPRRGQDPLEGLQRSLENGGAGRVS